MSRAHVWLRHVDGEWIVEDVGSTDGTEVAGQDLSWSALNGKHALRNGDSIRLGRRAVIEFSYPEEQAVDGAGVYASVHRPIDITPREYEVLVLLCTAVFNEAPAVPTTRELAATLVVAESTIKSHIGSLFEKFDVRDRTRLVTRAIDEGWVAPPRNG